MTIKQVQCLLTYLGYDPGGRWPTRPGFSAAGAIPDQPGGQHPLLRRDLRGDPADRRPGQGRPRPPATVEGQTVTYQVSTSGTTVPTGDWLAAVPAVAPGQYLWTKTDVTFNTGDTITWYSVSRMGIDGTGAVSTVCGVDPDSGGNVPLTGADIPQSSDDPTSVSTAISGKQAKITASGLLKGNGSGGVSAAVAGTDYQSPVKSATVTLSASAWSNNAQTVSVSNVTTGSLVTVAPVPTAQNRTAYLESGVYCSAQGAGTLTFVCEDVPSVNLDVNIQIINK